MLTTSPPSLLDRLRESWRVLLKEVTAFGLVGALSFVIDFGGFNLLQHRGLGPLQSTLISTTAATVFAYFGNTHLSFSHRARTSIGRETSFFFGINLIALVATALITAFFAYPLHYKFDRTVMNAVKLGTIALGSVFRFWAYKRFVFLHPDRVHSHDINLDEELAET
jgi:putative flippase GtrA